MKTIILFEEGYINLVKPNMEFIPYDEDEYLTMVEPEVLDKFMEANNLCRKNDKWLASKDDGIIWGYVLDIKITSVNSSLFYN